MIYTDRINDIDERVVGYFPAKLVEENINERCLFTEGEEANGDISCAALFRLNEYGSFGELLYIYVDEEYRRTGRGSGLLKHSMDILYERNIRRIRIYTDEELCDVEIMHQFLDKNGLQKSYEYSAMYTANNQQVRALDLLYFAMQNSELSQREGIYGLYDDTEVDLLTLHRTLFSLGVCVYDSEDAVGAYALDLEGDIVGVLAGRRKAEGGFVITDYADCNYGEMTEVFKRLLIVLLDEYIKNAKTVEDFSIICTNKKISELVELTFGWELEPSYINYYQGIIQI